MANIFVAKRLASGQLPSTKTTLYTVPASTTAYVKFLSLANTSGSTTETILIFLHDGTASRRIARVVLAPNETSRVIEIGEAANLGATNLIEGQSTNATTVDYWISGVEET